MSANGSYQQETAGDVHAPRIHLASLGCAKNLVDSERILGRLATAGALVGAAAEDADVILVNTCGFIGPAVDESMETIADYARLKAADPTVRLLVMGCLVERAADELRRELPEVDGLFGLDEHDAIVAACGLVEERTGEDVRLLLTPRHTAYLRISDGCNNRCAYCTIPLIRGPFRSRQPEEIVREAEQLVAGGARELNVIGQDTTSYGCDLDGAPPIHELLARLADIAGLDWLRLLYTHPAHFTDGLIDAYASIEKLCPYVDLPLQHLNDDILRAMGRGVTQRESLDLIERLRARIPGVAIRTTFIVGFPGETRGQVHELLDLVERTAFDHVGVFRYSAEEGTRAARMPGQVPERVKAKRQKELMLAQQAISFAANRRMLGKSIDVLIDAASDEEGVWIGRTATQAPDVDSVTLVRGADLEPGMIVPAHVVDAIGYDLLAEV